MVEPEGISLLLDCTRAFREEELPFMVVGAFAVMAHGSPRSSKDIDIVLRFPFEDRDQVRPIIEGLAVGPVEERTDPQWGQRLMAPLSAGFDLEVFFTPDHPWYEEEYERRVPIEIEGVEVPFMSPENLILRKLVNTRLRSGQDLADAINVAKVQADALDVDYLRANCAVHRVCGKLDDVLEHAGLA